MKNLLSQRNTFTGGLDRDSAIEVVPADRYVDAQDVQIYQIEQQEASFWDVAQVGRTAKLSNVRGHSFQFEIPDTPAHTISATFVWDITGFPGFVGNFEFYVSFNRSVSPNVNFISTSASGGSAAVLALFGLIPAQIQAAYPGQFAVSSSVSGNILTLTLAQVGAIDVWSSLSGGIDDTPPLPIITATTSQVNSPAQTDLCILGWAATSNNLALITTAQSNASPGLLSSPNYGQVWLLDISDFATAPTISVAANLKYNDRLNLSRDYQCQVELIEESDCIIRVYWTDNYNPPRSLLIRSGLTQDDGPDLLNFNPLFNTFPIIHTGWGNGSLPQGAYSYAYRYVTEGGATTPWVGHTLKINVFRYESTYENTTGGVIGQNSFRSVQLRIDSPAQDFKQIEVAAIYYQTETGPPTDAYIFFKTEALASPLLVEHFNNTAIYEPVTIDDLVIPPTVISRAKNLVSTENRMFLSNYCETAQSGAFPKDGISLGYVIKRVYGEQNNGISGPWVGQALYSGELNSLPFTPANTGTPNPNYAGAQYTDYKGSLSDHLLRGYWSDETYRYGIVFKYKDGTWGQVDWIGDFRFPDLRTEPLMGPNAGETAPPDQYFLRIKGLTVSNIDLNQLDTDGVPFRDKVVGFSIVRAPRDAQIIAQGALLNGRGVQNGLSGRTYNFLVNLFPYGDQPIVYTPAVIPATQSTSTGVLPFLAPFPLNNYLAFNPTEPPVFVFSPDISLGLANITASDTVRPVAVYGNTVWRTRDSVPATADGNIHKWLIDNGQSLLPESRVISSALVDEFGFSSLDKFGLTFSISSGSVIYTSTLASSPDATFQYVGAIYSGRCLGMFVDDTSGTFYTSFYALPEGNSQTNGFGAQAAPLNIVNIVRPKQNLYGGQTRDALQATTYIATGHYQVVTPTGTVGDTGIYSANVFGGDCFIGLHTQRLTTYEGESDPSSPQKDPGRLMGFPVESNVNFVLRTYSSGRTNPNVNTDMQGQLTNSILEDWEYLDVWSRQGNPLVFAARPINSSCTTCWPTRIIASREKVLGEALDSYVFFPANNIRDVEPRYGEINEMRVMADYSVNSLYFWQNTAFGRVPVNSYNLRVDTATVNLGTSELYGKYLYLDTTIGTIHKWSVCKGKKGFYWYDAGNRRLYRLAADGITDISQQGRMISFINGVSISELDNPVGDGGIHSIFDPLLEEAIFTLKNPAVSSTEWSLAWNEKLNAFSTFYSAKPNIYISLPGARLLSPDPSNLNRVYLHNANTRRSVFYANSDISNPTINDITPAWVAFVLNKDNRIAKRPVNLLLDINTLWEEVQALSGQLSDISGRENRLRGRYILQPDVANSLQQLTRIYQPRQGKWQGPVPAATDLWVNGSWSNNSVVTPISAEQVFLKIVAQSVNLREVATVDTYYTQSLRNT